MESASLRSFAMVWAVVYPFWTSLFFFFGIVVLPYLSMSILAIDYGEKNIGLALVPEGTTTAVPLDTITNSGKWNLRTDLEFFVKQKNITKIVVGMPLSMDGTRGPQAERVQVFADFLRDETPWDVDTVDERLSTAEAQRYARDFGIDIDSAAAVMIGQLYADRVETKKEST